jgi:hypothetical protein
MKIMIARFLFSLRAQRPLWFNINRQSLACKLTEDDIKVSRPSIHTIMAHFDKKIQELSDWLVYRKSNISAL